LSEFWCSDLANSRPTPPLAKPWNNFATGKTFTCARKLPLTRNSWCSALPPLIPITQSVDQRFGLKTGGGETVFPHILHTLTTGWSTVHFPRVDYRSYCTPQSWLLRKQLPGMRRAVCLLWLWSHCAHRSHAGGRRAVIHWVVHVRSWVNCEESTYSRPIACHLARSLALYPPSTSHFTPVCLRSTGHHRKTTGHINNNHKTIFRRENKA